MDYLATESLVHALKLLAFGASLVAVLAVVALWVVLHQRLRGQIRIHLAIGAPRTSPGEPPPPPEIIYPDPEPVRRHKPVHRPTSRHTRGH